MAFNTPLSELVRIDRVMTSQAAGTGDTLTTNTVDMQADGGYEGCLFVIAFGAITASAVTTVTAQQSADDSTYNDIEGSSISVADDDDDELVFLDIYKPIDRYLQVDITRATANAEIDSVTAYLYNGRTPPVSHATEVSGEAHVSPDEGTA